MTPTASRPLGFSFLYFGPRLDASLHPWFEQLRARSYDGAELPVVGATDSQLAATRAALDAVGLRATAVGFATHDADPISPDALVRERAISHLARLVENAAALGASVLAGPLHSAYGKFCARPPNTDEFRRCVDVLRAASDHAAAHGVRLALEPLHRFECYFLNTAADCDRLVQAIDHPAVCGALDTHHAHLEETDIAAAITASSKTLGHVQLSENHRGTPGTGQVDFARVLRALDDADYRGWLVIEAFSRHDPDFGNALHIWRELDAGPLAVLDAGAALVRSSG